MKNKTNDPDFEVIETEERLETIQLIDEPKAICLCACDDPIEIAI
jgi:hypothetical protein